jgi:coproporphyrinogen III oxidase-like Fe-S oxidoreductase
MSGRWWRRSRAGLRAEALFTGLRRTKGVDIAAFRARHGIDPMEEHGASLRDAFDAGLLEVAGSALRLTDKGFLLSNEVFQAFV